MHFKTSATHKFVWNGFLISRCCGIQKICCWQRRNCTTSFGHIWELLFSEENDSASRNVTVYFL